MNLIKLKEAEALFLQKYPEGFQHPEMLKIGKKHKMEQMINFAQTHFSEARFNQPMELTENMVKQISRSSMISMFEKPKFRDMAKTLPPNEREDLSNGLGSFLHGDQQKGFEQMVGVLQPYKLAKWSLMTIIPNYYFPQDEVFVKPTTTKGIIRYFELENLDYKPTPSWEFYTRYRDVILEMKQHVSNTLTPSNAAFCGFLMMSI